VSAAEELPDWARKLIARGATGYAAASTTASSISLGHLASAAEYDLARSVLFGVSFECAALITGTAWVAGRRGGWWFTVGRAATLGLLAASLVFNAAEVLQLRGILPAQLLLLVAVLVSAVFPIAALLFAHLALMVKQVSVPAFDAVRARAELGELVDRLGVAPLPVVLEAAPTPPNVPDPIHAVPDLDVPDLDVPLLDQVTEFVRRQRATGGYHGERTVMREFDLSRTEAKALLDQAKALLDLPSPTSDQRRLVPTG
jgi:hypothetical protein